MVIVLMFYKKVSNKLKDSTTYHNNFRNIDNNNITITDSIESVVDNN